MKTVITQEGKVRIVELMLPSVKPNYVLVKTEYSAISPGTEIMLQKKNLKSEISLGYSAVGIVTEIGEGVGHVQVGDRVACYGAPYVKHAECLLVPKQLAVPIPDTMDVKEASLVGLGAIAVHALRQADLKFGESVVIVGLGIFGQIIAQIASTAAYKVIAHDVIDERCDKLREVCEATVCCSAEELEEQIKLQTDGEGVDCVLLCVGGENNHLIDRGLEWIRERGKVVIVGDLKMDFSRELMFNKEASVLISRAGGPGRYDKAYEQLGLSYPIGYVRWTEGRNMSEFIRLAAGGQIQMASLITKVLPVQDATNAYNHFLDSPRETLGIVLKY
jgi:NADPH2:quinone reductase